MRSQTVSTVSSRKAVQRGRAWRAVQAGRALPRDSRGQGSVEIAVLLVAFLAIAGGLAALWHLLDGGAFVAHAVASASHCVGVSIGAWADVLAY